MNWHWSSIIYFIILFDGALGGVAEHYDITEKNEKRLRALGNQVKAVRSMLKELTDDKESCSSELNSVTEELKKLTAKIGKLTNADIDISDDPADTSVVSVKVPCKYGRCMKQFEGTRIIEENAKIWCLRSALWEAPLVEDDTNLEIVQAPRRDPNRAALEFSNGQVRAPANMSYPPTGFRVRREYRTLSIQERQNFHAALNTLYENGVIDTMARIHRRALRNDGAHGGPAFLPWHRAFLSFFEEALREVDPSVSLPYWDSSIDNNMAGGPGFSVMWDEDHIGQGHGVVDFGPFSGWVTANRPLRRDIARGVGSLIRQERIDTVMSFCRRSDFDRRWENSHNAVHRWIGGTMARGLSASDPVFYMHHAFIDYQWEKFREHQLNDCNIDPAFDYPPTDNVHQQPDTEMDGMPFLLNEDGIENFWTTNWYNYEDTPTCANNCGNNPDMFCDEDINLCVGEMRFDVGSLNRKKRQAGPNPRSNGNINNNGNVDRICEKNPYNKVCPSPPPPSTNDEIVRAWIFHDIEMPSDFSIIDRALDQIEVQENATPPDPEEMMFEPSKDEEPDCRNSEASVFALMKVVANGKKVSNRNGNNGSNGVRRNGKITITL